MDFATLPSSSLPYFPLFSFFFLFSKKKTHPPTAPQQNLYLFAVMGGDGLPRTEN